MKAIQNDIERRIDEISRFNYANPHRIATVQLLEDIATAIDFQQKQVGHAFKAFQWYDRNTMLANKTIKFHQWGIKKAALTRLQERYRKTLELLNNTK